MGDSDEQGNAGPIEGPAGEGDGASAPRPDSNTPPPSDWVSMDVITKGAEPPGETR